MAVIDSLVTAYSIVAVRSVGVKFSAVDRTVVYVMRSNVDADRCMSTVVAGVESVFNATAARWRHCTCYPSKSDEC